MLADLTEANAEDLVAVAGLHLLEVVPPSNRRQPAVTSVVIADPDEPPDCAPGDLILAVGHRPTADATTRLITAAGRAAAAGVAIKRHTQNVTRLTEQAKAAGVPLILISEETSWTQIAALLGTALATIGQRGEPVVVGTVPLGDLFVLADAVASMVGGAVTIEDPHSRVLAYSRVTTDVDEPRRLTILGQHVPKEITELLTERGVFRQLYGEADVVHVDAVPELTLRRRIAIAVRAGDEILGSIWVAEGKDPLPEYAEEALCAAARLAPLHLLRHRSAITGDQVARDALIRKVLAGEAITESAADLFEVSTTTRAAVLAFEPDAAAGPAARGTPQRVLELVSVHCAAYHRGTLPVVIGSRVYVLLGGLNDPVGGAPDTLVALAQSATAQVSRRLAITVRAGVGRIVASAAEAADSRLDAERVLRVLTLRGGDAPVAASWRDVAATAVLVEVQDLLGERAHLQDGPPLVLAAYDRKHRTDLLPSLRAYFDAFGDIPSAARAVQVHPNTLRYRLGRIVKLTGLNLDDPEERLVTALQLRLHDLPAPRSPLSVD